MIAQYKILFYYIESGRKVLLCYISGKNYRIEWIYWV